MLILAADIGGTKTDLALYGREPDGSSVSLAAARFQSRAYPSFDRVLAEFLGGRRVDAAGLACAGPVVDGRCKATNLPWELDARTLGEQLGAPVALSNDFAATVLGVPELTAADLAPLSANERDPAGPIAVLGAGTGLGEGIGVPTPQGLIVLASEGGHADLPVRDELEIELFRFLKQRHPRRVSLERALSGPGLVAIYEFVVAHGLAAADPVTAAQMQSGDPAEVIARRASSAEDPACDRALSLFVSLYGSEAGNFALKVLPTGGLFIAGGMAPKLIDWLKRGEFMRALCDKGRMSPLLQRLPVAVVMNPQVALLGARALATMIYRTPRAP